MRDQAFISYSQVDHKWLDRLLIHLKPYLSDGKMDVWNDRRIGPSQKWREEIQNALKRARVAVLLVTPNYLASDFIANEEIPVFLRASEEEGLKILWIPVKPSAFKQTPIGDYQPLRDPAKPLAGLHHAHLDAALVEIGHQIKKAFLSDANPVFNSLPPHSPEDERRGVVSESEPSHALDSAPAGNYAYLQETRIAFARRMAHAFPGVVGLWHCKTQTEAVARLGQMFGRDAATINVPKDAWYIVEGGSDAIDSFVVEDEIALINGRWRYAIEEVWGFRHSSYGYEFVLLRWKGEPAVLEGSEGETEFCWVAHDGARYPADAVEGGYMFQEGIGVVEVPGHEEFRQLRPGAMLLAAQAAPFHMSLKSCVMSEMLQALTAGRLSAEELTDRLCDIPYSIPRGL